MLCTTDKAKILCPALTGCEDDFLKARLESIESAIVGYTHNHFCLPDTTRTVQIVDGVFDDNDHLFVPGDTVRLHHTLRYDGVYDIAADGRIGNLTAVGELALVRYPQDVIQIGLQMLVYEIESKDKAGLKSETISRHSVSYGDVAAGSVSGYPDSITGGLRSYRKMPR